MEITKLKKERLKKEIPELFLCGCFIGGGCIRDSINNKKYNDIDIFGKNEKMLEEFKYKNFKNNKFIHETKMVKTFFDGKQKYQLINKDEINSIEDFIGLVDFTICQFAFDGEFIYCTPESLIDLKSNKLVINKISMPIDTMRRLQKYIQRGFTICNGGIKEIAESIQSLTKEDIDNQTSFYSDGSVKITKFD